MCLCFPFGRRQSFITQSSAKPVQNKTQTTTTPNALVLAPIAEEKDSLSISTNPPQAQQPISPPSPLSTASKFKLTAESSSKLAPAKAIKEDWNKLNDQERQQAKDKLVKHFIARPILTAEQLNTEFKVPVDTVKQWLAEKKPELIQTHVQGKAELQQIKAAFMEAYRTYSGSESDKIATLTESVDYLPSRMVQGWFKEAHEAKAKQASNT
jgi:hypothetical protein